MHHVLPLHSRPMDWSEARDVLFHDSNAMTSIHDFICNQTQNRNWSWKTLNHIAESATEITCSSAHIVPPNYHKYLSLQITRHVTIVKWRVLRFIFWREQRRPLLSLKSTDVSVALKTRCSCSVLKVHIALWGRGLIVPFYSVQDCILDNRNEPSRPPLPHFNDAKMARPRKSRGC